MRVYVIIFQLDKYTDTLVFSSNEYMVRGLINYIQKASTKISRKMLRYFEEYQDRECRPWEWLFTDLHDCGAREFEILLKPFNCKIFYPIVDAGFR